MIEKLKPLEGLDHSWLNKINELVDAVNNLQTANTHIQNDLFEMRHPKPDGDDAIQEVIHADPYAEQRKWIGKVCKFWDDDPNDYVFDKLKEITALEQKD